MGNPKALKIDPEEEEIDAGVLFFGNELQNGRVLGGLPGIECNIEVTFQADGPFKKV